MGRLNFMMTPRQRIGSRRVNAAYLRKEVTMSLQAARTPPSPIWYTPQK